MGSGKTLQVRGKVISGSMPAVCLPITGRTRDEILKDTEHAKKTGPDMIEWRADFFEGLGDETKVTEVLTAIRERLPEIPVLFTVRSEAEGGQPVSLKEEDIFQLTKNICEAGLIDIVDFELRNQEERITELRKVTRIHKILLLLSYHNFSETPEEELLIGKCQEAERYGADIVKTAVMANTREDVLDLLNTALTVETQFNIPAVTISMGGYGLVSRVFGWMFGSPITFGAGEKSSAPGQLPVEELMSVLETLRKNT
ncbi:type I 3-dehydroquinate dehydratase [Evansella sp. LMS18]|jgi:3-dehydroquinate dehydratase-1|uniref:type I 3-dehydroquinate dehydratase n=1 Tax=Evansella sp. LMS18 TaxID=2924033 RepID=UPI0020D1DF21|nr:type I 3-dehydroquinate dehydratase [Evansella sp. LMS18]UTR11564.1 type I 3-dehydroquinate dehydratase [Evansella sp. LMS18]